MGRMHPTWVPAVDEWVVYRPAGPAVPGEDGVVTEVISETMVRVLYAGDRTAKATRVADLEPGVGP